jgi:hypothetical protein
VAVVLKGPASVLASPEKENTVPEVKRGLLYKEGKTAYI